jgi:ribonuclease HI
MKSDGPRKLPVISVWTDGSAWTGDRRGGWAAVLKHRQRVKVIYGGLWDTTSQRAELTAAIKALSSIRKRCMVVMVSDSQYLVNGLNQWVDGWAKRGWVKADGDPVLNQDLWKKLLVLREKHYLKISWVKGHADDEWNICADYFAGEGRALSTIDNQSIELTVDDIMQARYKS